MADEALSIEGAIGALIAPPADDSDPGHDDTPPENDNATGEDLPDDDDDNGDAPDTGEYDDGDDDGELSDADLEEPDLETAPEDDKTPIPAPASWTAEEKQSFAKLPRDLQEVVQRREADRDKAVSIHVEKATTVSKALEKTTELLTAAQMMANADFDTRWGSVDWAKLASENPEAFKKYKKEMEEDKAELDRVNTETSKAQAAAHASFLAREWDALQTLAPQLRDETKVKSADGVETTAGAVRRQKVAEYAIKAGVVEKPEDLRYVSAAELTIAFKAMQYDEAIARANARKPGAPRNPPNKGARPNGGAPAPASATKDYQAAVKRLNASGLVDDAVQALAIQTAARAPQRRARN